MIKCYCYRDVESGIFLLKLAAKRGFVRSSYTLGLILRDFRPNEASVHLHCAASKGYLPALQEILPAREMKAKYGEPTAKELRQYLDPLCLNRLLCRQYVHCSQLRGVNTSHCWNPLCGRWAFKTHVSSEGNTVRIRRPYAAAANRADRQRGVVAGRVAASRRRNPGLNQSFAASRAVVMNNNTNNSNNNSHTNNDGDNASNANGNAVAVRTEAGDADSNTEPNLFCLRVSRMKMCSRCCRAKYCSKLCQVYDWRSGRHKTECHFL